MSEMVERCARVAYERYHEVMGGSFTPWNQLYPWHRGLYIEAERAAIAAMREPTFDPDTVSYHQGMTRADWWRAMIDRALKEAPR